MTKLIATNARGRHRLPEPPNAVRGRATVVAVAAGAAVAASVSTNAFEVNSVRGVDAAASADIARTATPQAARYVETSSSAPLASVDGPRTVNLGHSATTDEFESLLAKGRKFAAEREAQEAAMRRPLFTKPVTGQWTSTFGMRWGALHGGDDIAAPIGTPIYAVEDGVVAEAGPAAGYGMWVKLRHFDGTVTMYGHVDTTTVSAGQRVLAGDQIATVGNRGFSTGPHLHFEVWPGGNESAHIDPEPWLASRGISLGSYTG